RAADLVLPPELPAASRADHGDPAVTPDEVPGDGEGVPQAGDVHCLRLAGGMEEPRSRRGEEDQRAVEVPPRGEDGGAVPDVEAVGRVAVELAAEERIAEPRAQAERVVDGRDGEAAAAERRDGHRGRGRANDVDRDHGVIPDVARGTLRERVD